MTRREISDGVGGIAPRYIQEAVEARPERRRFPVRWLAAAVLALCLLPLGLRLPGGGGGVVVSAYAAETEQEITGAGVVLQTGTIRDSGEMRGHPLLFYLAGRDIAQVRFSCKEQQLNFVDWTEQRAEFGNAQNFTVPYGGDPKDYRALTIDWVPDATIRALTDDPDSTIASLPERLRKDTIVMEITFTDGSTAVKAIQVTLRDDGSFFASFGDYQITSEDEFVQRPDSEGIPREILYGP